MPTPEIRAQINQRLARSTSATSASIRSASTTTTSQGGATTRRPRLATSASASRSASRPSTARSTSPAGTTGPFRCTRSPRCSRTRWRWQTTRARRYWPGSGSSQAATPSTRSPSTSATTARTSGVAGAILAVVPGKLGIGVYSPGLDAYGNSVRGVSVCKEISAALGLHIFATEDEDALLGGATPAPRLLTQT